MKCGDCKNWTPLKDWEGEIRGWGRCERIEHGHWEGDYDDAGDFVGKLVNNEVPQTTLPGAYTMDASDYHSHLDTNELFGCILFEKPNGPKTS